jgi:hypothetical protein
MRSRVRPILSWISTASGTSSGKKTSIKLSRISLNLVRACATHSSPRRKSRINAKMMKNIRPRCDILQSATSTSIWRSSKMWLLDSPT